MAESALSYPSLNQVEVAISNAQGSLQTSARFAYDGLGRISMEAIRIPGTSSLGYVESEFRHKTYRYDGTGTVWRESDWLAYPCFGLSSDNPWCDSYQDAATLVAKVDPLGRPEHVISSDGSEMVTSYSGGRRQEIRVGSGDGSVPLRSRQPDCSRRLQQGHGEGVCLGADDSICHRHCVCILIGCLFEDVFEQCGLVLHYNVCSVIMCAVGYCWLGIL